MSASCACPHVIAEWQFDMGVCVPSSWTDAQVEEYARLESPRCVWRVRTQARFDELFPDEDELERRPCAQNEGFVHMMVEV